VRSRKKTGKKAQPALGFVLFFLQSQLWDQATPPSPPPGGGRVLSTEAQPVFNTCAIPGNGTRVPELGLSFSKPSSRTPGVDYTTLAYTPARGRLAGGEWTACRAALHCRPVPSFRAFLLRCMGPFG
jgi:hypothetical protein